jgi:hypothetical protein
LDAGDDACVPGDFGVPASFGGVVESVAEPVGGQAAAAFGEQEVGGPAVFEKVQPKMRPDICGRQPGAMSTKRLK